MLEEMRKKMWSVLLQQDTETALQLMIDCYGRQLLSKSLYEHMIKEGYLEEEEEGE